MRHPAKGLKSMNPSSTASLSAIRSGDKIFPSVFGLMSVLDAIQSLIWLRVNSERESRPKTGMM